MIKGFAYFLCFVRSLKHTFFPAVYHTTVAVNTWLFLKWIWKNAETRVFPRVSYFIANFQEFNVCFLHTFLLSISSWCFVSVKTSWFGKAEVTMEVFEAKIACVVYNCGAYSDWKILTFLRQKQLTNFQLIWKEWKHW